MSSRSDCNATEQHHWYTLPRNCIPLFVLGFCMSGRRSYKVAESSVLNFLLISLVLSVTLFFDVDVRVRLLISGLPSRLPTTGFFPCTAVASLACRRSLASVFF